MHSPINTPPPIPKVLRIRCLLWRVELMDATTANIGECYGVTLKESLTIKLQDNLPPSLLADTMLHECVHAMLFSSGAHHSDTMAEEDLAKWLPGALAQLFIDNPDLELWWVHNRIKQ